MEKLTPILIWASPGCCSRVAVCCRITGITVPPDHLTLWLWIQIPLLLSQQSQFYSNTCMTGHLRMPVTFQTLHDKVGWLGGLVLKNLPACDDGDSHTYTYLPSEGFKHPTLNYGSNTGPSDYSRTTRMCPQRLLSRQAPHPASFPTSNRCWLCVIYSLNRREP